MPYSYGEFKQEVKQHILTTLPKSAKILDVGPGCGTYSHLLREFGYSIDCVEVWEPYIHQFNLKQHYDNVYLSNVMDFDIAPYDYIIMGDILEHLSSKDAIIFLKKIETNNQKCLVAVPYEYEQEEYEGNTFEIHLQPDLTPQIMKSRYSNLELLYGDEKYGYYINYTLNMKEVLIQNYNNLQQLNLPFKTAKNTFTTNFIGGARLTINGEKNCKYKVLFIDRKTNDTIYETEISNNMWTSPNIKYFKDWRIEAYNTETNELEFSENYSAKGKRVYIHLESNAIGDTLAWFPHVDEFRKKHQCELIVSTFHNEWFKNEYPEIEFIEPGTEVFDLYAMYNIGWFYDENREVVTSKIPIDFKKYPLGQTTTEILGLKYKELKPRITIPNKGKQIDGKYVVIAPHGSAHAKYWNYPGGWQAIVDYLKDQGYKVVMITKERLGDDWHDSKLGGTLKGVIDKTGDYPIEDRMVDIKHADAFIGIGSGLSWLSWAVGTKVVLISGFSEPYSEFLDCERVFNYDENVCTGCFNKEWLNPGDWEWCPSHKDTDRHFECTKTITPERVIESINRIL